MYAREDTVNWLLAKRANTSILGGPLKQSCVHLASARRSGQAAQVLFPKELELEFSPKYFIFTIKCLFF